MKFSENWLREWVNPSVTTADLVAKLTMAGLEVDAVEPACEESFTGVIVGKILSAEQHPDAERLRVCAVEGHQDGVMRVVCGAANARPGIKIPFATIGAHLPGDFKIKKAKLRGVESFGMLCGQTELKMGDDDTGLWELPEGAPVGSDLNVWLQTEDQIIEVDLTPNRSDCLSIRGLAREVGVLTETAVESPQIPAVAAQIDDVFDVDVVAQDACPVYVGRVLRNVDVSKPSPIWLVEKLRRSGIRSIDAIVDVTNYVLLELGQPMHAFDLDKLKGGIAVRMAKADEEIKLLNEQTLTLREDTLVIADQSGAQAVAGVMGGDATAVGGSTQNIFLESAFFTPRHIAGKARSYGLHTDSSHRFERGVDYRLQQLAIERATALLMEIVGGNPGPVIVRCSDAHIPQKEPVTLTRRRLEKGLSLDLSGLDIAAIMQRLGLELIEKNGDGWTFSVPSYRFDIEIEEDLLEEVARIYGYDKLPTRALTFSPVLEKHSEVNTPVSLLKSVLCSRGYQEIITYSFVDPKIHQQLFGDTPALPLRNPISADLASMRTSLLPGLISTLNHNLKRQQTRAQLFELGMVFQPNGDDIRQLHQGNKLAALLYGTSRSNNWAEKSRESDFFDLKGDLEALLHIAARGKTVHFEAANDVAYLHPGQAARIFIDQAVVGVAGALHPSCAKQIGLSKSLWLFECDLNPLTEANLPVFSSLSRFPEVSRDLAIVVDKAVCVADINSSIRKVAGNVLKELKLFDVYSGEGIDPKGKSLAFSLTFQGSDRTLTDEEVNASMAGIVTQLEQQHNATLR